MIIRGIDINLHPNEALSNHIRREGDFFEADILDYIKEHHPLQKTILDIGANIGNHTIYFANFLNYERIVCFEPVPDNYQILSSNLHYPRVKLYQLALNDTETKLKIAPNYGNMGASRVDPSGSLEVMAVTLDSLKLKDVSLMKIDVEDHEPFVLKGAAATIERYHPLILIEDWRNNYSGLLPGYILEKDWPKHRTYLYRWPS